MQDVLISRPLPFLFRDLDASGGVLLIWGADVVNF